MLVIFYNKYNAIDLIYANVCILIICCWACGNTVVISKRILLYVFSKLDRICFALTYALRCCVIYKQATWAIIWTEFFYLYVIGLLSCTLTTLQVIINNKLDITCGNTSEISINIRIYIIPCENIIRIFLNWIAQSIKAIFIFI